MKKMLTLVLSLAAVCCMAQQAEVRIDVIAVDSKIALTPGKSELKINKASWMTQNSECYLTVTGAKLDSTWKDFEFSFTPDKDGKVLLELKGPWYKAKDAKEISQIWVAYDNLAVTGATFINPDFETVNEKGLFDGWNGSPANMVVGSGDAKTGANYLKVWHNQSATQAIMVTKDQTVTVKFSAKEFIDKKSAQ
ncbi:MAG: hypothetical protein ACYC4Q_05410 [Victivallaceae bacterium]